MEKNPSVSKGLFVDALKSATVDNSIIHVFPYLISLGVVTTCSTKKIELGIIVDVLK